LSLVALVDVGGITDVGLLKIKITVDVALGSGVSVKRGVDVRVGEGVRLGRAAEVLEAAALAVCAMKVLIALGLIVGTAGAPTDGTQAMITTSVMNQIRYFAFAVAISPLAFSRIFGAAGTVRCLAFSTAYPQ